MKCEELRAMGLTDDQINAIMRTPGILRRHKRHVFRALHSCEKPGADKSGFCILLQAE